MLLSRWGGDNGHSQPGAIARSMLKLGTSVTIEGKTWELPTDVTGVQIVYEAVNPAEATILIPGYGVCRVARDQVAPINHSQGNNSRIPGGGVTTLQLQFAGFWNARAAEGLPRLLKLVGGSLTSLWLDFSCYLVADVVGALPFCPRLKTLIVTGSPVDTASFLRVYRESNLVISDLDCFFDDLSLLAAELSDKRTRIAQNMKRVVYSFATEWDQSQGALLTSFVAMLHQNRTIEYVHLKVPAEVYHDVVDMVSSHHNKAIPGRFPQRC